MCSSLQVKRGLGIDITHTPTKLICSSLQVKRWRVLTLHIPPPNQCAQVSKSRGGGGGIDITHTPHQTDVLNYPSGGVSILMGKFSSQFQNQKLSTVCRLCWHKKNNSRDWRRTIWLFKCDLATALRTVKKFRTFGYSVQGIHCSVPSHTHSNTLRT